MITVNEGMRQLYLFAKDEERNRAFDEAADLLEKKGIFGLAAEVRQLKRDPSKNLTDWWADEVPPAAQQEQRPQGAPPDLAAAPPPDFFPIGA